MLTEQRHLRPEVANKVANELVTLFLDENIKQRTERASETTEFLTREADKLGQLRTGAASGVATESSDAAQQS